MVIGGAAMIGYFFQACTGQVYTTGPRILIGQAPDGYSGPVPQTPLLGASQLNLQS